LSLVQIKEEYPYAVINTITTSIGGEQAETGELRFADEVLAMRPDVLLIDYALNDRNIGLERAKEAWQKMIDAALAHSFTTRDGESHQVKVILMTPTPDTREDISSDESPLAQHAAQIRKLAIDNNVGLIDSYALFKELASKESLAPYMAQANHINGNGHQLVANEIAKLFVKEDGVEDGLYFIKGNFTGRFMTVKDSSLANDAQIVIDDSLAVDNQKFYVKKMSDGYYISPYYTDKILGMQETGTDNGVDLVLMDSTGAANERFSFVVAGGGYYWLQNNNSSKYIATPGSENEIGTRVIQWQFYNNLNYQWKFIPVDDSDITSVILPSINSMEEYITIYPNPTQGNISILKADDNRLLMNVFSLDGKHFFQQGLTSKLTELSLPQNIQPGMYLFAFSDKIKNESIVKKVLLQRHLE
jgi:hypothetical protein